MIHYETRHNEPDRQPLSFRERVGKAGVAEFTAAVAHPARWAAFWATFDTMRKASLADVEQLVSMMAEFYSESPYTLNLRRATEAFTMLLADERLGRAWFIQVNSKEVGYVVLTLCHSMTYGGLSAIVDDFFIRPAFRGTGLGKAAMAEVRSFCATPSTLQTQTAIS